MAAQIQRTHLFAALFTCLVLGTVQLACAAVSPSLRGTPELRGDGKAAAAFCAGPAIKQRACGWADDAEVAATTRGQRPFGGTVWRGLPSSLPATITADRDYWQYAGRIVSLACRPGKLVVRMVFKPTRRAGSGCVRLDGATQQGSLVTSGASLVTRCRLELPPFQAGAAGAELAAAVKSKEVDCAPCANCSSCPHQALNAWYSDTLTASWEGCAGLQRAPGGSGGGNSSSSSGGGGNSTAGVDYLAFIPAIVVNPGTSAEVANYQVQEVN